MQCGPVLPGATQETNQQKGLPHAWTSHPQFGSIEPGLGSSSSRYEFLPRPPENALCSVVWFLDVLKVATRREGRPTL